MFKEYEKAYDILRDACVKHGITSELSCSGFLNTAEYIFKKNGRECYTKFDLRERMLNRYEIIRNCYTGIKSVLDIDLPIVIDTDAKPDENKSLIITNNTYLRNLKEFDSLYPKYVDNSKFDGSYIKNWLRRELNSVYGYSGVPPMFRNIRRVPQIEKVIFNEPATIVKWADSTKTVVKAGDGERFDPEKGLAMAISKKALGNQGRYYETFKEWIPEEERKDCGAWTVQDLVKLAEIVGLDVDINIKSGCDFDGDVMCIIPIDEEKNTGVETEKVVKKCSNCKHRDVPTDEDPCEVCGVNELYDHWETYKPKPDQPQEIKSDDITLTICETYKPKPDHPQDIKSDDITLTICEKKEPETTVKFEDGGKISGEDFDGDIRMESKDVRHCNNCKYYEKDCNEEPCVTCRNGYSHWEAYEPETTVKFKDGRKVKGEGDLLGKEDIKETGDTPRMVCTRIHGEIKNKYIIRNKTTKLVVTECHDTPGSLDFARYPAVFNTVADVSRYLDGYNVPEKVRSNLIIEPTCITFFDHGAVLVTFEVEKCCENCIHDSLPDDVYPCSICSINGSYEYWEPKVTED